MHSRRDHRRQRAGQKPARFGKLFTGRSARHRAHKVAASLGLEQLEPRLAMAGVVINEFLAINSNGIQDEDFQRSDWIELKNTDAVPVSINGWYLADSVDQWQIPNITLAAGEHLLIFASNKDRSVVGQPLHTNFEINGDGESLKLLMPDGVTIVHAYDPFPAQVADVSYGLGTAGTTLDPLVNDSAPVNVKVPTNVNDVVGTTWTTVGYVESGWTAGDTAIGYERGAATVNPNYNDYFNLDVNSLMPATPTPRDTIYMRIPFQVFDVDALQDLTLGMQYDDGFVAYLNGHKIAERNAPASPLWNSSATAARTNDNLAVQFEPINVSAHLNKLVEGPNMLAVHGLNFPTNRVDFLIGPKLQATRELPGVDGYMVTPTPGEPNAQGTLGFVEDTKFSVDRGFYDSPFTVEITTATAGAEIRYTLDGSEPTASTGLVYSPASPPLINQTTSLRASAFKSGYTPANIDTQTYIFLDDVIQQSGAGLPPYAAWGNNLSNPIPDWEMDPNVVNDPLYANTIKDDLKSVPTVSLVMPWNSWFGGGGEGIYISGENIERQTSVEMFTADGTQEFQIDAAVEIQGQTSTDRWKTDKLSLQITFKEPFGPTKLNSPIFTDADAAVEFDTFILDSQVNYTWSYGGSSNPIDQRVRAKFIQDQYVADLQNLAGGQAPHGRVVHLYLNGLYWGIYMLHERPDDSFGESYLGGDKDDYDVVKHNGNTPVAGDATAPANYAAMLDLVRQDMTVPANYEASAQMVDVDNLLDYMIVNYYAGNDDWAHKNWYATFNRVDPEGKWRFHSWDAEHVLKDVNYDAILHLGYLGSPEEVHVLLMANEEYRLKFADHVQRLFHNGGLLTPTGAAAVYMARMQEVDRAIVAESARWGDNRTTASEPPGAGGAYTREHWLATQNDLLANYFPNRTRVVLTQFTARGWLTPLAAPLFSQYGGELPPGGYDLVMTKPEGSPATATIYYTLDGSDPRNPITKLPSASAIAYSGPIHLETATQVKARIFYADNPGTGNDWSAVVDALFLPEDPYPVRITELHYHPASKAGVADEEDMEFIELTNTGTQAVNLAGVQIVHFATTPYTLGNINLAPGQRIVVTREPSVFQQVYGTGINLVPTGYANANLGNSGERIALHGPHGEILQDFVFDDVSPWPESADGGGYSLHIINPLGDPTSPANWRASIYVGGSPGAADVPIPGDYDRNGLVQHADQMMWRAGFGIAVAPGMGADGNGDGMVDAADYVYWRRAFAAAGSDAGSGIALASAAPAASQTTTTSTGTVQAKSAVLAPPAELRNVARSAFRPAHRTAGIAPPVDLMDLLTVELGSEAVDSAFQAEDVAPRHSDSEPVSSAQEAAALWDDGAWLDFLSVRLA